MTYLIAVLVFLGIVLFPLHVGQDENGYEWIKRSNLLTTDSSLLFKTTNMESDFNLLQAKFYQNFGPNKYYEIKSDFTQVFESKNFALLHGVDSFFYSNGEKIHAQSKEGRSFMAANTIEFFDGVVLSSEEKGYSLFTQKIFYDGGQDEMTTEEAVTLVTNNRSSMPNLFVTGVGLRGFISDESYTLLHHVHTIQSKQKQNASSGNSQNMRLSQRAFRITSDKAQFLPLKKIAFYEGHVEAFLFPSLNIKAQTMKIVLDKEDFLVEAHGAAQVSDTLRQGKGRTIRMNSRQNTLVLEDKAQVVSGDHRVSGDKITLFLDEDRMMVESAQGHFKSK